MNGGNTAPYRLPCISGSNEPLTSWLGSPYQHARSPVSTSLHIYSTTVPNPAGSGSAVDPYERFASGDDDGTCETHNCTGAAPCNPWIDGVYTLTPGQSNSVPDASFTQSGSTNFETCRKAGFKNVTAHRNWHGMFGLLSGADLAGCNDTTLNCSPTSSISYLSYQSTAPQTKYLTITRALSMNWTVAFFGVLPGYTDEQGNLCTCGGLGRAQGTYTLNGSINLGTSYTVDKFSGEIINNGQTYGETPTPSGDIGEEYGGLDPMALLFTNSCGNGWQAILDANSALIASEITVNSQVTASSGGSISDTAFTSSYSIYSPVIVGGVTGCNPVTVHIGVNYVLQIGLSDPNHASDVYSDAVSLLGSWPLNDDALYPWRTDGCLGVAPLVSRNETGITSPDVKNIGTVDDLTQPTNDRNNNAPFTSNINPAPTGWTYNPDNNGSVVADAIGNAPYNSANNPPPTGWVYNPMQSPQCNPPGDDWVTTYDTAINGPQDWQPTYVQIPWFDTRCYGYVWKPGYEGIWADSKYKIFDSSILGGPLPAGFQNQFDFNFTDWHGCSYDDGLGTVTFDWYQYGYGMNVGQINEQWGTQLPLNATQVTDAYFSIGVPPGASIFYNNTTPIAENNYSGIANMGGGLVMTKYCEIKERWPSQNFYLGGNYKFFIDEPSACCVNSLIGSGSGATFTSVDYSGTPITITDISGYWGGASVDGFYNITTDGGSNVTLGTKIFNVPSDWTLLSGDEDTAFGQLRFPTASSLLGRCSLSIINNTGSFSNPQTNFGMSNTEQIDLYDKLMLPITSNVTAQRIDDSHFTLPSASYHNSAYAMIHGSPPYYINDEYSKGDYLGFEWTIDYRANAEHARLSGSLDCSGTQVSLPSQNNGYSAFTQYEGCISQTPCCPSILCCSPNGEIWPTNAINYPFPESGSFELDEKYGSQWQFYFQQAMTNIFYQGPHNPCANTIGWTQDDGTCQQSDDTSLYYKHLPQVEARASLPSGFPALPSGVKLGYLSPVTNTGDNVKYPPLYSGFNPDATPASLSTPWGLRSNLCNSILNNCPYLYEEQNPPC